MKNLLVLLFVICFLSTKAQVDLGGYIQPFNASPFPTHKDSLGKGGYVVAKDTAERNAITCLRRKYGMAVYVQSLDKLYILKDSSCNNTWVEFSSNAQIPTLQQVLDYDHSLSSGVNTQGTGAGVGNTGTNCNIFGELAGLANAHDNVNLFGKNASATSNNQTVLAGENSQARINYDTLTSDREYTLPDKSGKVALISDIVESSPTLQQVLTKGDTSKGNPIVLIDSPKNSTYIRLLDSLENSSITLNPVGNINTRVEVNFFSGTNQYTSTLLPGALWINRYDNYDTSYLAEIQSNYFSLNKDSFQNNIKTIYNGVHDFYLYQADTSKHVDTLATLKDMKSLTLQQVTDAGDTTTNNIVLKSGEGVLSITNNGDEGIGVNIAASSLKSTLSEQAASFTYNNESDPYESFSMSARSGNSFSNLYYYKYLAGYSSLKFNSSNAAYNMPFGINNDTLATLRDIRNGGSGGGSGTVTSITSNYGLTSSPNPITTSGTISVDTATLSNKYLRIADTSNKWVNSVTGLNDSTIRVIKDGTTTDITIRSSATVTSATRLITTVYNNSGSTITKGSVVYINGRHSSNLPTIALAQANTEQNSYATFALVQDDITNNNSGIVIQAGNIANLNLPTSSYTDGQVVFLSPTIAGGITTTKPLAPDHIVKIGTVTRAHPTLGSIEIKIENGWQLDELSDVQIATTPADSTLLQFSRVDSLWHAVSPSTAIGSRYIKPSDTASMLTNYAKTSSVNLKVNISDTASMLTNYVRSITLNGYTKYTDTASMLSKYLRKTDTATLSSRIDLRVKYSDTSTMLSPYLRKTDTATLSNRINLKQDALTNPVTGTGTNGSLTKFNGTSTVTNATVDVDYLQQDMSMIALQALGSSIKCYNVGYPNPLSVISGLNLTSQQLRLFAVYIPKAVTITGAFWYQTVNGNFTANNYNGIGLYSYSGGTLTLQASSTNDGTIWQGGIGYRSKAFSSTYSAAAGIYFIGIIYSSSAVTTAPALAVSGANSLTGAGGAFDFTNSAKVSGTIATQTSLPSTQASSGITSAGIGTAMWLY